MVTHSIELVRSYLIGVMLYPGTTEIQGRSQRNGGDNTRLIHPEQKSAMSRSRVSELAKNLSFVEAGGVSLSENFHL